MRTALIDIGSNTIRFVAYEQSTEIENFAHHAGLIADVGGGKISVLGIKKITDALNIMKKRAKELRCDNIYAFATASLRDIDDKLSLAEHIFSETGVKIDFISGAQEAMYDLEGLRTVYSEDNICAFDLGGGSCQLLYCAYGKIRESASLPIGSLKLFSQYVSGTLPTVSEADTIAKRVRLALCELPLLKGCRTSMLYAMGGAGFALLKLSAAYLSGDGKTLSDSILKGIMQLCAADIEAVTAKRLKTAVPAAITMCEILNYTGCDKITVTSVGVRDGILKSRFPWAD